MQKKNSMQVSQFVLRFPKFVILIGIPCIFLKLPVLLWVDFVNTSLYILILTPLLFQVPGFILSTDIYGLIISPESTPCSNSSKYSLKTVLIVYGILKLSITICGYRWQWQERNLGKYKLNKKLRKKWQQLPISRCFENRDRDKRLCLSERRSIKFSLHWKRCDSRLTVGTFWAAKKGRRILNVFVIGIMVWRWCFIISQKNILSM